MQLPHSVAQKYYDILQEYRAHTLKYRIQLYVLRKAKRPQTFVPTNSVFKHTVHTARKTCYLLTYLLTYVRSASV